MPYFKTELEDELASELIEYIHKTEDLRSQLEIPYIFVYQSERRRKGSQRKPSVVTAAILFRATKKYSGGLNLFDKDGFPIICSPRRIRALCEPEL